MKHTISLGKESDCGDCVHEFLCIDYEQNIKMIDKLSEYKLSYQRLFITLFSAIAGVILAVLKLPGKSIGEEIVNSVGLNHILGLIVLGTCLIGYVILKNLASTRISEMFFCRSIRKIREIYAQQLGLPHDYPQLKEVPVKSYRSADYQMILFLSVFNWIFLCSGISLIIYNPDNFKILPHLFSILATSVIYWIIHISQIEIYLKTGDQKFAQLTMGEQVT